MTTAGETEWRQEGILAINRRHILAGGAVLATAYAAVRAAPAIIGPRIAFEPLEQMRGFRRFAGGGISSATAPFAGIAVAAAPDPLAARAEAITAADICGALFETSDPAAGVVHLASFSDYYCPYCRVQTKRLGGIESRSGGAVKVTWHELPLLGDSSVLASRAALAARRQGRYPEFHARMMKAAFQATPGYLEALAETIGLDYSRLSVDMTSPEVDLQLHVSAALARRFGFYGTPGLVIGKTAILGEIGERVTLRLIEIERKEGLGDLCISS